VRKRSLPAAGPGDAFFCLRQSAKPRVKCCADLSFGPHRKKKNRKISVTSVEELRGVPGISHVIIGASVDRKGQREEFQSRTTHYSTIFHSKPTWSRF